MKEPSQGLCYGCRHVGDKRFSATGHCNGTGHLEGNAQWPGFICTCYCVSLEDLDKALAEIT
jgi:hypothetical protein